MNFHIVYFESKKKKIIKEKHMDMACVRDQNIKAHIQVHGIMALKCLVFTSGQGNFLADESDFILFF